jgi:DNA invertase Pin-like site-specific DNA recombinase
VAHPARRVFSEFAWNTTSDCIKADIARARKEGKRIGRTCSAKGLGKLRIARTLGCGVSTVQRVLGAA